MIQDAATRFKTAGGSEDLATSATTEVLSDYMDLVAAGFADGGHKITVTVWAKSSTFAVGAYVDLVVRECATSGGTYTDKVKERVLLADIAAAKTLAKLTLPQGMKRYVKFAAVPATSTTGALTVNAGLDAS